MRAALLLLSLLAGCDASWCPPGQACALIGVIGELGFNGDELPARKTRLAVPTAVRVTPDDRVAVVDFSNMRIRALDDDGRVRTLAGAGIHAFSEPGLAALETPLENPIDARWDADGRLVIVPLHEGRVLAVGPDGLVEVIACTGESMDVSGDGGPATAATMGFPAGVAFGDDGAMYIADSSHHVIRRVSTDGVIDTVAGTGERGLDPPGPALQGRLNEPGQLDVRGQTLYITDTRNHRVAQLDLTTSVLSTFAGRGARGYDGDGGPADAAALAQPLGVFVDGDRVWIADGGNGAVRVVEDGVIETVVGGLPGAPSERGPLEDFVLGAPSGIAAWRDGYVVSDRDAQTVVRFSLPR